MQRIWQLFFLCMIVMSFSYCSSESGRHRFVNDQLNAKIAIMTGMILEQSRYHYSEFQGRLYDPQTAERAIAWVPLVEKVKTNSSGFIRYTDSLIDAIEKLAEGRQGKDIVSKLFFDEKVNKVLYNRMVQFKKDILKTEDEFLMRDLKEGKMLVLTTKINDSLIKDDQIFGELYFKNSSAAEATSLLRIFQSNIRVMENTLLDYVIIRTSASFCGYYVYMPVISQNSTIVRPGEKIEISAGVGYFSRQARRKIIIDNQLMRETHDAISTYTISAPEHPGTYSVPVKIEFQKPDGTKASMQRIVEYSVVQ
jgi:hypothetical protein